MGEVGGRRKCYATKGWCYVHHQWWSACKAERATREAQKRPTIRRPRGTEPLRRLYGIKMSDSDVARLEAAAAVVKTRPSTLAREAIRVAIGNIIDRRVRVREKRV